MGMRVVLGTVLGLSALLAASGGFTKGPSPFRSLDQSMAG
jgi:hypothetical protein